MKEQPRAEVIHFEIAYLNKMKILQITQKLLYEKFYVHKKNLRTGNLSRIYFLKSAKKARKPNNRDLNHD